MADPTYIACPRCGEPYAMTPMQKRLFHGRTLACQRCAKPFTVTEETPDPVPAASVRPWHTEGDEAPAPAATAAAQTDDAATGDARTDVPLAAEAPAGGSAPQPRTARKPGDGMTAGQMALLLGVILLLVSAGLYFAFAPSIHRAREAGRRAECAGNLQQIGIALQIYANGSGGRFPDTLGPFVLDGSIPAALLVCPSSRDTIAPGSTVAEQAANLPKGRHQSYIYIGKGLTLTSGRQVLAYEPLAHHDGQGVNVLFSDGSVQFLPTATALIAIPQLAPTTQPAGTIAVPAPAARTQPAGAAGP